jgi:glycosyltransferase involved in cell wall biosynthesis
MVLRAQSVCVSGVTVTERVSVVIPVYNESKRLPALLNALLEQDWPGELEIIVVDGRSTDDSREIASRAASARTPLRTVRIVDNPRRAIPVAVNLGTSASSGAYIVRVDGHCSPPPDLVSRLVCWLREHGERDIVYGRWEVLPGEDTVVGRAAARAHSHPLGTAGSSYRARRTRLESSPIEVDTVPYGCFRKSLWATLGGFDENLKASEDYDFMYRARLLGGRVVLLPDVVLGYYCRSTVSGWWYNAYRAGFWVARLLRKHRRVLAIRKVALPSGLLIWLAVLLLRPWFGLATLGVYLFILLTASLVDTVTSRVVPCEAGAEALLLAVMHLGYAVGFLAGAITR